MRYTLKSEQLHILGMVSIVALASIFGIISLQDTDTQSNQAGLAYISTGEDTYTTGDAQMHAALLCGGELGQRNYDSYSECYAEIMEQQAERHDLVKGPSTLYDRE